MKTKNLLNPKNYVHALSNDKIDAKPLFWLIGIEILTLLITMFGFEGDAIKLIKLSLAPLNQTNRPENLSVWIYIITNIIVMAIIYLLIYVAILIIINFVIKVILKLLKKEISLWKLMNITIYAFLANQFLFFIFTLTLTLISALIKNALDNQIYLIKLFPDLFIILAFILYCYAIVQATKINPSLFNKK